MKEVMVNSPKFWTLSGLLNSLIVMYTTVSDSKLASFKRMLLKMIRSSPLKAQVIEDERSLDLSTIWQDEDEGEMLLG